MQTALACLLVLVGCSDPVVIDLNLDRLKTCLKTEDRCLIVLSVATKNISAESYQWYTEGLKKFDYDFHIIGTNLDWNGWITRGEAMKAALETLSQNFSHEELEKKIIVATSDTGDVLVQEPPQQLMSKFEKKQNDLKTKFGSKLDAEHLVIVGGEWFCGVNCERRSHEWFDRLNIDKNQRIFPYAQGGFLMGPAAAAKKFYAYTVDFMKSKINDDQIAMGNFAIEHPAHIYIDYQQEIAATIVENALSNTKPVSGLNYDQNHLYELADKGVALGEDVQQRIGSTEKIYPTFLHVPNNTRSASAKTYWEKLVDHLKIKTWK